MLDRVHGGAVLRSGAANIAYDERRRMNEDAKAAIGRACAAQIPDNSSLILNIGTTTEAVARELLRHRHLTVVTNNMNIANILAANESCDVVVAGGQLRRSDGGLVGDLTSEFMANFKADFAIIGCSALDGGRPKSSMSHHFRVLRESGLVRTQTDGPAHMNELRREEMDRRFPGLLGAVLGAPAD